MSEQSAEKDAWRADLRAALVARGDVYAVVQILLAQAWDEGHRGLCRRHGAMPFEACRNPYVLPPGHP